MSGRLTTHVLDTSIGFPAEGIRIALYSMENSDKNFIKELTTNSDGRTDQNLLNKEEFFLGDFEENHQDFQKLGKISYHHVKD